MVALWWRLPRGNHHPTNHHYNWQWLRCATLNLFVSVDTFNKRCIATTINNHWLLGDFGYGDMVPSREPTYPLPRHFWVDDFPFPKVGYASFLESHQFLARCVSIGSRSHPYRCFENCVSYNLWNLRWKEFYGNCIMTGYWTSYWWKYQLVTGLLSFEGWLQT